VDDATGRRSSHARRTPTTPRRACPRDEAGGERRDAATNCPPRGVNGDMTAA
jgi:hypothetical protein